MPCQLTTRHKAPNSIVFCSQRQCQQTIPMPQGQNTGETDTLYLIRLLRSAIFQSNRLANKVGKRYWWLPQFETYLFPLYFVLVAPGIVYQHRRWALAAKYDQVGGLVTGCQLARHVVGWLCCVFVSLLHFEHLASITNCLAFVISPSLRWFPPKAVPEEDPLCRGLHSIWKRLARCTCTTFCQDTTICFSQTVIYCPTHSTALGSSLHLQPFQKAMLFSLSHLASLSDVWSSSVVIYDPTGQVKGSPISLFQGMLPFLLVCNNNLPKE